MQKWLHYQSAFTLLPKRMGLDGPFFCTDTSEFLYEKTASGMGMDTGDTWSISTHRDFL